MLCVNIKNKKISIIASKTKWEGYEIFVAYSRSYGKMNKYYTHETKPGKLHIYTNAKEMGEESENGDKKVIQKWWKWREWRTWRKWRKWREWWRVMFGTIY